MPSARKNPYGLAAPPGVHLVRVGEGEQTHIWDAEMPIQIRGAIVGKGIHLCQSGKNAGNPPRDQRGQPWGGSGVTTNPRNAHDATFVTCYRCAKIGSLNLSRYGTFLRPRGDSDA